MIYVDRTSVPVPEILRSERAIAERARVANLLTGSGDKYEKHVAQLRITFNSSIWSQVIPALMKLFENKCAYCESQLSASQPVDIEHFRPKQGAEDLKNERAHLYYSWLAYEWDNMLIACVDCNRRRTIDGKLVGKAQLFPLESPRAALMASVEDCRRTEMPLLIDPCYDDPADHLTFEESGLVSAKTPRGATTIEVLGLNLRKKLVETRQLAWKEVSSAFDKALSLTDSFRDTALQQVVGAIEESQKSSQPHLAARQAAFEHLRRELQNQNKTFGPRVAAALQGYDHAPENAPPAGKEAPMQGGLAGLGTAGSPTPTPSRAPAPRPQPPVPGFAGSGASAPAHASAVPPQANAMVPPKKIADRKELPPFAYQRIRRIEIRNFKAIESLDLDVPPEPPGEDGIPGALMMLGENATGKSTVLDAVALALLGTKQIRLLELDGREFLRRESLVEPDSEPRHPTEIRVKFEESEITLGIDLKGRFSGNADRAVVLLGYGPRRFFGQGAKHLNDPAERIKSMFDPLVTLPNPKQWLLECSEAHFAFAVRALRTMLLLPDEAVVERRPVDGKRKTHVVFELEGRVESLDSLSEGYKTILAMGVDIMREMLDYWTDLESAHGVVLVDELDTHLHPRWKMRIAHRLRHALPEVQFLASTHDPLCLRGYHDGEVQVLRRDAGAHIERIIDLPNVQGLSVQQLLTSEFFGLYSAEDPALEQRIARYVTLANKRDRSPEEEAELTRQRDAVDASIQLGTTPQEKVVQQALTEYLVQNRTAPQTDKSQIERDTVNKLVSLWNDLDTKAGVQDFAAPDRTP